MIQRIAGAAFLCILLLSSQQVYGSHDNPGFSQEWINKLVQSARQDPGPNDKFNPLSDDEIKSALCLSDQSHDFEWFQRIYGGTAQEVYEQEILNQKIGMDYRAIEDALLQTNPEAKELTLGCSQTTLPVAYPPQFYGLKKLSNLTIRVAPGGNPNEPVRHTDLCSFRLISELSSLRALSVSCPSDHFPIGFGLCQKLQELQVQTGVYNILVDLPGDLFKLTNLTKLNLTACQIRSMPDGISQLQNLVELNVSGNAMSEISDTIGSLVKLQILDISLNRLTALPDSVTRLSALEELNVGLNRFNGFPFQISKGAFPKLKSLNIWGTTTKLLPDNFVELSALEGLYAGDNPLETLPSNLHEMKLKALNVGSILTAPPSPACLQEILKVTSLKNLSLQECKFGPLPQGIGELRNLTHLNLNNAFSMDEFAPILYTLTNLVELDASATGLKVFPVGLGAFQQLEKLTLGQNAYDQLCEVAPDLPHLKNLNLGVTNLSKLPDWIGQLGALESLSLYDCALDTLPDSLGRLSKLQNLNLSRQRNGLMALPGTIIYLKELQYLDVEKDGVETLPYELKLMEDSGQLLISGFTGKFSPPTRWWCTIQ